MISTVMNIVPTVVIIAMVNQFIVPKGYKMTNDFKEFKL